MFICPTPWPVFWLLRSRGQLWLLAEDVPPQPRPSQPQQSLPRAASAARWLGQVLLGSLRVPKRKTERSSKVPVPPGGDSLPFPPSGSGPAHRKWLSTVSFFVSLGSPVMNRVRLTCRRNTPGRKVTRASQSARGTPCSSLSKENDGLRGSGACLPGLTEP